MQKQLIQAKAPGETLLVRFSFENQLAVGETISGPVATAAVYSGTDATPSAIISGSASVDGGDALQKLAAGTSGVIYTVTCTCSTSLGQTLKTGLYLAVVDALNP